MGRLRIVQEWSGLLGLTCEQSRNLTHLEKNPVYRMVVSDYSNRAQNAEDPYTFYDILYWLDYEANMDEAQNMPRTFTHQATGAVNRWLRKYYPEYANDSFRPWGIQ